MNNQNPIIRNLAQDCVRAALGRNGRVRRVANHRVWLDGQELEWLTIFAPDGGVRLIQHAPTLRTIGILSADEVQMLTTPTTHRFSEASIRGHFRSETRRRA